LLSALGACSQPGAATASDPGTAPTPSGSIDPAVPGASEAQPGGEPDEQSSEPIEPPMTAETPASPPADPMTPTTPTAPPAPTTPTVPTTPTAANELLVDRFTAPDGLITNEYAYRNPGAAGIRSSPIWELTSGSMFTQSNLAWSGVPDGVGPNASSSNATDSAVFRARTKRQDFVDTEVSFSLKNNGLSTSSRTPAESYDGVHAWTRYVSDKSLYAITINRRDSVVVIKKKVPGGPSNGGTYYTLASKAYAVPYGTWQDVQVTTKNNASGSVTIQLSINGTERISATDSGIGGPPIREAGRVGVRGDNCDFHFDDFVVKAL